MFGHSHKYLIRCLGLIATAAVASQLICPVAFSQDDNWVKEAIEQQRRNASRQSGQRPKLRPSLGRQSPLVSGAALISRQTLRGLDRATQTYRQLVKRGGWPKVPNRKTLRPGDSGKPVRALTGRLRATGDLSTAPSAFFDRHVEAAVKRFQARHGLTASGKVNSFTRAALNKSAKYRLDQLIQNRRRIAAMVPVVKGRRYVLINIPSYDLQAVNDGRSELYGRVVVGKPSTPTPVLSAKIRALNTLPYWHVPQSIVKRQLIPALKKDPNYLAKQKIRVFASWGGEEIDAQRVNWWAPQGQRYVFRQEPGPHNALGLLRLDMPNKEIVYIHDTPLKKLYNYQLRPYSAGCVRAQTVFELGEWLLAGDRHQAAGSLRSLINARQKETLKLAKARGRSLRLHHGLGFR